MESGNLVIGRVKSSSNIQPEFPRFIRRSFLNDPALFLECFRLIAASDSPSTGQTAAAGADSRQATDTRHNLTCVLSRRPEVTKGPASHSYV